MRSGLKMVITRSRIRKNFTPSRAKRIFECPVRCRACTGSKRTEWPARMKLRVIVVGDEKPFGSRPRNSRTCSRRIARKPDVRSGIGRPAR